tara:strand:- start:628 stop:1128 length:501 start_codon:yes stop_codon:yes gene_type:complete
MNIFYLDSSPAVCAHYHCNKHVVKMILEYSQLLSTAHHECDGVPSIECYKATHKNHPSALWARENTFNYKWLYKLLCYTASEYTTRYGKVHLTERKGIIDNLYTLPKNLPVGEKMTAIPQCMPDEYKVKDDPISAYRNYYIGDKSRFAKWQDDSQTPTWFLHGCAA